MPNPKNDSEEFDINEASEALKMLMMGGTAKAMSQHANALVTKFAPYKANLERLKTSIDAARKAIAVAQKGLRKSFDPTYASFSLTKSDTDEISILAFINQLGAALSVYTARSYMHLEEIAYHLGVLLPVLSAKDLNIGTLENAEASAETSFNLILKEFVETVLGFPKLLGTVYLSTKVEYKKLRRQFLGEKGSKNDRDPFEDKLLMSLFGTPSQEAPALGPAIALLDDNVVLTKYLMDISDALPKQYEKTVPIIRKKKSIVPLETKVIKTVDGGEVEDFSRALVDISNSVYVGYIKDPKTLLSAVLQHLSDFYNLYWPIEREIRGLIVKSNLQYSLDRVEMEKDFVSPDAIKKPYSKINFCAIRPPFEDITPRTKMERDYAEARTELLVYLRETVLALSGMHRGEEDTEEFATTRIQAAIELRTAMEDVLKTEYQKNLSRNIRDDNEFYVTTSGQLGSVGVERAPAPKIHYDDVSGKSFTGARGHIDEVINIASHPNIMRLSAPRGDIRSNLLLIGPYGCHRKGQGILMYDGFIKKVEDVVVGDQLMGPDSTPREVLRLVRGVDKMAKIVPKKGDSWVVNQNHTLSLVNIPSQSKSPSERIEVPVCDYQKWPKYKKNSHSLYRVPIDFIPQTQPLSVDPYMLGVLLGDGCLVNRQSVCTPDPEIVQAVYACAASYGLSVSVEENKCPSYHLTTEMNSGKPNPLRDQLREIGLFNTDSGTKFIPFEYKTSSRENRLQLLAGILDTDGHLYGSCCYDYVTKSKQLAEDVVFVVRSLGFAAYIKPCKKKCQTGAEGTYYRMIISGEGIENIPLRINRKVSNKRTRNKNVLRVGFCVKNLPEEEFFGFTVNVDNLYLLDDFIVTRNCGKSEFARAIGADARIIGLNATTADLLTAYMHESVKNVKRLYDEAGKLRKGSRYSKPVCIILDEFDGFFSYGEGIHQAYDGPRMEKILQEMMDGVVGYEGVFLVALTNVPKAVPKAILRRFKFVDVVGQLTKEERADLFKKFLMKGLPISSKITDVDYLGWAETMDHAPGDVIGKVADEIHFKFLHDYVENKNSKASLVERTLSRRLKDREANDADRAYIRASLSKIGEITADDVTKALTSILKQPQVKMQIDTAREVYKDADEIMQGLSTVGKTGFGFGSTGLKKSELWSNTA